MIIHTQVIRTLKNENEKGPEKRQFYLFAPENVFYFWAERPS